METVSTGDNQLRDSWFDMCFKPDKRYRFLQDFRSYSARTLWNEQRVSLFHKKLWCKSWFRHNSDTRFFHLFVFFRFRSLAPMYYRGAAAVIVVFDLTSRKTLEGVKYWMDELQKNGPANAVVALVGNKADLAKQMREVGENEGEEYAESLGAFYKETSARTGYNVQELFKELCRRLEKPELQVAADSGLNEDGIIGDSGLRVRLHDRTKHPRRGCCSWDSGFCWVAFALFSINFLLLPKNGGVEAKWQHAYGGKIKHAGNSPP